MRGEITTRLQFVWFFGQFPLNLVSPKSPYKPSEYPALKKNEEWQGYAPVADAEHRTAVSPKRGRKKSKKTTPANDASAQVVQAEEAPDPGYRNKGKNDKRRAWFVVLNNPRNYLYHWYMAHRIKPEVNIKTMPQADLAIALAKTLCPEGSEEDVGVSVNIEEGNKTGTEHSHIVYYKPATIRFNQVRELFYGMAHIEAQQGTKTEAEDYLNKRGKWENDPKGHTLKVPPFHLGLVLGDNRKGSSGEMADRLNDIVDELIEKGMRPSQIATRVSAMGIDEARYADRAERVATAKMVLKAEEEGRLGAEGEQMFVVWHIGKSGTGKTHSIRDLTRDRGKCHLIDPRIKDHPWDSYELQPFVLWDEFRDTHMAYDAALAMLNREGKGSVEADARFFVRTMAYCRMDLTSIVGPEKQWAKARAAREADGQDEPLYQLTRRINLVVYHFTDDRYPEDDSRHWCSVAMPGGRVYKNADQLVRRAAEYLKNPYTGPQPAIAFEVDTALGATVKEKDRPKLLGPADEVERKIRVMMWEKFEKDPYRDLKLAFLGLTDEEKGVPASKEKMLVADDTTVGQPKTEQIPVATQFVSPSDRGTQPSSLNSVLGSVLGDMAQSRGGEVPEMFAERPSSGISFGSPPSSGSSGISFSYDQEAEVPLEAYGSLVEEQQEDDGWLFSLESTYLGSQGQS